jgi:hypothetical protein
MPKILWNHLLAIPGVFSGLLVLPSVASAVEVQNTTEATVQVVAEDKGDKGDKGDDGDKGENTTITPLSSPTPLFSSPTSSLPSSFKGRYLTKVYFSR